MSKDAMILDFVGTIIVWFHNYFMFITFIILSVVAAQSPSNTAQNNKNKQNQFLSLELKKSEKKKLPA